MEVGGLIWTYTTTDSRLKWLSIAYESHGLLDDTLKVFSIMSNLTFFVIILKVSCSQIVYTKFCHIDTNMHYKL